MCKKWLLKKSTADVCFYLTDIAVILEEVHFCEKNCMASNYHCYYCHYILHLHICWMNFVAMHNFMQSHNIVAKMTENCETTENLDSNATNYDSNATKLCRCTKKVAWIFLISWFCTIFRFSIILWCFCHKIVLSNVQVLYLVDLFIGCQYLSNRS